MFNKSIFQGRLQFDNQRSFEKAKEMYFHRLENYHKAAEIVFEAEDIFLEEELQVYIPRTVVNILEKAYKSTVSILEYVSQFAISGHIGTWMLDEGKLKHHTWMEPESDKTIIQNYLEGKRLSQSEEYDEALAKLTDVIDQYEKHSKAYEYRGYVNYKLQRYGDAIRDFNKSILYDDQNAKAYLGLGRAHMIREEYDEAVKFLELATKSALALQEDHWIARRLKGDVHFLLKEYNKAEFEYRFYLKRKFDKSSSNYKHYPKTLLQYAITLFELEQYGDAIDRIDMLLDMDGLDQETKKLAFHYRGLSKDKLGKSGHLIDWKKAAELGHKPSAALLK